MRKCKRAARWFVGAAFGCVGTLLVVTVVAQDARQEVPQGVSPQEVSTEDATPAPITENAQAAPEPEPAFTPEYLAEPAHIETGAALWEKQCRHCHGRSAYPGKAPKLKPRRYKPDFVYARVTYGFGKMPAWENVYSLEERMAIVSYILSKEFSP